MRLRVFIHIWQNNRLDCSQDDHLPGKPGNVREFDSCQGKVREKILSGKSCLTVCCKLHICVHSGT